jgi:hypothetical protein
MKPKTWKNNPVSRPAKESTMAAEANFNDFTQLMKRVVSLPQSEVKRIIARAKKPKTSSSRVPAV